MGRSLPVVLSCWLSMFSFFILSPAVLSGQTSTVPEEFYSLNEGLSDRQVTDIIQSETGMTWIGTNSGLNKFDGYKFTVFNNYLSEDPKQRLSSNDIQYLEKDKNGNLVIFYNNNLAFFDLFNPQTLENQKIELFKTGVKGFVRTIYVNRKGEIYVLSIINNDKEYTNVYKFSDEEQFELVFSLPESHLSPTPSVDLLQTNNGLFFISDGEKGVRLVNDKGSIIKKFGHKDFDCLLKPENYPGTAYFLHQDRMGRVWYAFHNNPGLYYYNPDNEKFEIFSYLPEDKLYTGIWEDELGNVLFAQTNGLGSTPIVERFYCYSARDIVHDFSYITDLSDYFISIYSNNFFETIFMGIDTGLKIIQNTRSKVKKFLSRNLSIDRRGAVMRGIDGDNNGLVYFAREIKSWYILDEQNDFLDTLNIIDPETGNPLSFSCGMDINIDKYGKVWGITCNAINEGQLISYDPENCNFEIFRYPSQFNAFTIASDGTFWLAASPELEKGKLVSFRQEKGIFVPFTSKKAANPLKNMEPRYVLESQDGTLWIGSDNGLLHVDIAERSTKLFKTKSIDEGAPTLSSNTIYVIHEDSLGRIWVGTKNGINILNLEDNTIKVYKETDGLASNTVCGILPDDKGNYWISTYNGLSYFDPGKETFKSFFQFDGLSHDEFNRFSFFRGENGRNYFGGVNGVNAFYDHDLLVEEEIPPVALTSFTKYDSKSGVLIEKKENLHLLNEVTINPSDSYFQFHFALPDYSKPNRNQFSYWLEGFEKGWNYLGNAHTLRYNSLPPDTYTLHLKGADPNGNWSKEPLKIRIKVQQVYYKRGWFIALCVLLVILAGRLLFQYKLEQKVKVERLRTKLSSDIHDEVSGLLSGIAMQSDVLQMLTGDEAIQNRLKSIGEASRKAMSKMSDVIWSIDSRKDRVEDLVQRMREHADDILLPINIRYNLQINRLELQQKIPANIRQELYFIYKEAINNIVKHADASKVTITLGHNGQNFEMVVTDNGKGSPKKSSKSGQGLSNIRMRAQRINAILDIIQDNGYTIQLRMKKFPKTV